MAGIRIHVALILNIIRCFIKSNIGVANIQADEKNISCETEKDDSEAK